MTGASQDDGERVFFFKCENSRVKQDFKNKQKERESQFVIYFNVAKNCNKKQLQISFLIYHIGLLFQEMKKDLRF